MTDIIEVQPKFAPFFLPFFNHKRYKGLRGGRGSGKTTAVATHFVLLAWTETARFLCCREIQKSIKQSNYKSIQQAVNTLGLQYDFAFLIDRIRCLSTGSEFLFQGLRTNAEQILSMEGIKYVWIEQAEMISDDSLKLLTPTIRANKSEIWATWNPRYPQDSIELLFNKYADIAICKHINFNDNPFFPAALELERRACLKYFQEDYEHVWLGHYREDNDARTVLLYRDLKVCVGAAEKLNYKMSKFAFIGVDVADGGADKPAYAVRQGSSILEYKELNIRHSLETNGYEIATRILPLALDYHVAHCYYDATGVGASMKSEFYRVQKFGKLPFTVKPFLFGGAVRGKDKKFIHGITNAEFFSRLNAQGYWNLRLRLMNTKRALSGSNVDLDYCLFLPKNTSEQLLRELSQIVYDRDSSDKIRIDKQPDGKPSPNLADAVMMSFAHDLRAGLRIYETN